MFVSVAEKCGGQKLKEIHHSVRSGTRLNGTAKARTATPSSRLFNPGTGRAVFAGVRYRL
jgi:hypothetical protein